MKREELEALPPEAYLDPELFKTDFDGAGPHTPARQYRVGYGIGLTSAEVQISESSTWGASRLDGSSTTSYEKIGYHAGTTDLLRGFLASGVRIVVYRRGKGGVRIQEYKQPHVMHEVEKSEAEQAMARIIYLEEG